MKATAEQIYGPDNLVDIRKAISYAQDTRSDKEGRGAVTREDVKEALCALCDDPAFIDAIRNDYREEDKTEIGRTVAVQIDIARAHRLQDGMP